MYKMSGYKIDVWGSKQNDYNIYRQAYSVNWKPLFHQKDYAIIFFT